MGVPREGLALLHIGTVSGRTGNRRNNSGHVETEKSQSLSLSAARRADHCPLQNGNEVVGLCEPLNLLRFLVGHLNCVVLI